MRDLLAATHLRLERGAPLLGLLRRLRLQRDGSEGPPEAHARMVYFDRRSTYAVPAANGVFAASWSAKQELEARLLRPAPPVLTPPSPVAPVQAPGGSR